jgi:selenide,water dikinase
MKYAQDQIFPGGACNNQRTYQSLVDFAPGIAEETRMLLFTPETSGGLLVAVPPDKVSSLVADFDQAGHPCWVIGEVVEGQGIQVVSP